MQLTSDDRHALGDALIELRDGQTRRFEDILWLQFGDEWTRIRRHLAKCGYVRYSRPPDSPGGPSARIEAHGVELLERLLLARQREAAA